MSDFRLDDFRVEEKEEEKKIYSLNMYEEDFKRFNKVKSFKILEENNLSYTKSEVFSWGVELLKKEYPEIERGQKTIRLRSGKRTKDTEKVCRQTSVYVTTEDKQFINDFLYYKVWKEEQLEYTRAEMINEMLNLIEEDQPNIFK